MEREISVGWRRVVRLVYISVKADISVVMLRNLSRLCQICYKYCGIGRFRLSLVSLQIAGWLSAENFENSV